jgi:hypothetical protein
MERPYEQQHDLRRDARPVSEITKLDVLEVILAGHQADEITPFAQTRFAIEIRPIIGIRNSEYEFIVNPIVDVGFGKYGEQHFAPAARAARKFDQDLYAGFDTTVISARSDASASFQIRSTRCSWSPISSSVRSMCTSASVTA